MDLLKLHKLTVRFGGLTAVQDVDCAIGEKQILSIIGPNGAGKTTVFNAVTGIYDPSSGSIEFRGRRLERPLTWRVLAACAAIGLVTGCVAALLSLDVNALWRATIKRNYAGPGEQFSYAGAWNDARAYVRGELALERMRGNRWAVRTADGRLTLGFAQSRDEAQQSRARFEKLIARAGTHAAIEQRHGRWVVRDPDGGEDLATFAHIDDARAVMEKYSVLASQPAARRAPR